MLGNRCNGQGSSPRMRGAPCIKHHPAILAGIIPAYAGSTKYGHLQTTLDGDHPRVCGEHLVTVGKGRAEAGSSPRMRGALLNQIHRGNLTGIIPAYAGSTQALS